MNKARRLITSADRQRATLLGETKDNDSDIGDEASIGNFSLDPGYTAPASNASQGYGPVMPAQESMYTTNKRTFAEMEDEMDAEGEEDEEWAQRRL